MKYEIDFKHKIIYIEDDGGKDNFSAMDFDEFEEFFNEIRKEIKQHKKSDE